MDKGSIKVLHLVQGLGIGGLENVVVNLLKGIDSERYQPSVCCYDTLWSVAQSLNGIINIHFLKRKQGIDYAYPFKLAALLKREKIQILHLHNSTAFFYGVIAGKITRVPVIIYTEHARDIFPNIKVRIADKILSSFTDKVIVVADYLKKNLIKYEWFNPSKIITIYNGADETKFNNKYNVDEVKRDLGLFGRKKIVGIVARLDPIKNHKCLIKAMQIVVKHYPDTILLVIGDGALRDELKAFARESNLLNNIYFLGTRQDIPQLLAIMDIFVLCSISEGLPMTLLEAMAAGKPIIATNVGGIPEIIEHGINGVLIPPDNPDILADAIKKLIDDTEKAKQMGSMAREKFENNFTLSTMVKNYEEVYESFITSRLLQKS